MLEKLRLQLFEKFGRLILPNRKAKRDISLEVISIKGKTRMMIVLFIIRVLPLSGITQLISRVFAIRFEDEPWFMISDVLLLLFLFLNVKIIKCLKWIYVYINK